MKMRLGIRLLALVTLRFESKTRTSIGSFRKNVWMPKRVLKRRDLGFFLSRRPNNLSFIDLVSLRFVDSVVFLELFVNTTA